LSLTLISISALAADAGSNASLVTNGDFELDSKSPGWPDDWGKQTPGITRETEEGRHFLRLVSQEPGKMLMVYREIPIPAGTKSVEISIRYRTSNVQRGEKQWFDARAIFHFLDSARGVLKPDPKPMIFSLKADSWTEATQQVTVPAGAHSLQLMPSLYQVTAGTLDLAEVRVTPVNDGAAN
jgi:hypothetical protein